MEEMTFKNLKIWYHKMENSSQNCFSDSVQYSPNLKRSKYFLGEGEAPGRVTDKLIVPKISKTKDSLEEE